MGATALLCACLEPNPNAIGADTGTSSADTATTAGTTTNTTSADSGGPVCDPCDLAFETVAFEARGSDVFTTTVPKPDQPHTVPIASVREYSPGNVENLGYRITWTELDAAWEIQVELTNAANNSQVSGIAAVIGAAAQPSTAEATVVAADMCGTAMIGAVGGRTVVDAVEAYEPGADTVLSYERSASQAGDDLSVDYCITASDSPEASLRYKVVAFEIPPEGVTALDISPVVIDSAGGQSVNYDQLPANAQVLHLLGAQAFDDQSVPDLGYRIGCSTTSPYGCNYQLIGFKGGASATAGGSIVAIQ